MKKTLLLCLLLGTSCSALAQSISPPIGAAGLTIGTSAITGGTAGRVLFESATNKVSEDAGLTFDPATDALTLGANVTLLGEAANILAQRNGVSAQTSRVYNTFTDASNGSWTEWDTTTANTLILATNGNGSGVATMNKLRINILGTSVLRLNTTGDNNTAVGVTALSSNTTGINNTAIGVNALLSNTTGANNTAVGVGSLQLSTTGGSNSAIGVNALLANTTGSQNSAVGVNALLFNTTGVNNSAVGLDSLRANTTGAGNTAVGAASLSSNTTGSYNTTVGLDSLWANTAGINNTAVGVNSLLANTTGGNNTAVGFQALVNVTGGGNNSALGVSSGLGITTGNNNTILGANVSGLAAGLTGAIILAQGDGTIKLDFGVTTAATWTSPVALKTLKITTSTAATFHETSVALTDGVGASSGTILNAPAAGNPTKWIGINDNGTTRYIPAW